MKFCEHLLRLGACKEAGEWVRTMALRDAWDYCDTPSWMIWLCSRYSVLDDWANNEQIEKVIIACIRKALDYAPLVSYYYSAQKLLKALDRFAQLTSQHTKHAWAWAWMRYPYGKNMPPEFARPIIALSSAQFYGNKRRAVCLGVAIETCHTYHRMPNSELVNMIKAHLKPEELPEEGFYVQNRISNLST